MSLLKLINSCHCAELGTMSLRQLSGGAPVRIALLLLAVEVDVSIQLYTPAVLPSRKLHRYSGWYGAHRRSEHRSAETNLCCSGNRKETVYSIANYHAG